MRTLLLGALTASATLCAGIAYADNLDVPPPSPHAVMAPANRWAPVRVSRHHPWRYERRAVYREPNYVHDTAPPPGLMSDQPTTIGGYPLGY